jgi:hypothetical protein
MPEVVFARRRVRRNPYAARIAREGIQLVHDEPSAESLVDLPEASFAVATHVRRNPYASRAAEAASKLQYGRGRPSAGSEVGPTTPRSLRLPEAVWSALEAEAKARSTTVHALLREVIMLYLERRMRTPGGPEDDG